MRQIGGLRKVPDKEPATEVAKKIRRATRRHFSAEDQRALRDANLRFAPLDETSIRSALECPLMADSFRRRF
jgi:hypothetical protein